MLQLHLIDQQFNCLLKCTYIRDYIRDGNINIVLWWIPLTLLNIKTFFPGMGIPVLKIRQSQDRLIFNMVIPILVRWHLHIQTPIGMIIIDPNVDTPKSKKSSLLNCTWFKYTYSKSMMNKEILYMICRWPNIVRCYDILWCSSMTKLRSHAYIDSVM